MEFSGILSVVFMATAICMVLIKAIREKLIDKYIIFNNRCPTCNSSLQHRQHLARHKILGSVLFVDVKYLECDYCHKKILFIGPRGRKIKGIIAD